ncbi:Protein phosphatase 2C (PP2C)-like domain [Pseudocohnilembus persalinus]|uniref:Protein phosphatase 2C (PP2C)-like domain n=1 Tax=Pseudocohnilembus persalinus TaxID=266149 RepID=A0A0V0R8Z5_PSEPJ|nr:Protein phosphatase 2C (PP2C)-like domain [Pseudocohnilembus persalinus]|eukprot:KRX10914.1 Protein phosphatase 2C (PP2C)-like domain [Pseudocohnilembus persalinus]
MFFKKNRDNLHKNVTSQSCFPQNPKLALQKGFEQTEKQFMDQVMDNYKKTNDICYTANLGDCRAIISKQNGEICQQLTRDHKPSDDKEKIRILNSGGNVYQSKVPHFQYSSLKYKNQQQQVLVGPVRILPGRLSISRGFGDAEAKFEEFGGNNKVLIATPEITQFKIEDNFDFILLGCDGIFDCVQNKELVGVIWEAYKNRENLQIQNAHQFLGKAAEISLNIAAYKKSTDNLTTVIVGFKQLAQLLDPVIRVWLSGAKTYYPALKKGMVLHSFGVGRIISSKNKYFQPGQIVFGNTGFQQLGIADKERIKTLAPIEPVLKLEEMLYIINNGIAAYFGVELLELQEGDTCVISTAAGATGILACQVAKSKGARVIGITGSEEKCQFLLENLNIDVAINYKDPDYYKQLKKNCPKGIDAYFDNVGEDQLNNVLKLIKDHGRIALCGAMSSYTDFKNRKGVNMMNVVSRRVKIRGFTFGEFLDRADECFQFYMEQAKQDKIKFPLHVLENIKDLDYGLKQLFVGNNIGKKDKVTKTTPLERLLRDATNNDNWSTPPKILSEIADATFSYQDFNFVMKFIWERLQTQKNKSWRKTYKVLCIIDYLMKNGAPRCLTEFKDEIYQIRSLRDYTMFEENQDRGEGVREKVKQIMELLNDEKRLDEERDRAKNIREAMSKHSDFAASKMGGGSKYGSYGSNQTGGGSSYAGYSNKSKATGGRNYDDDFYQGGKYDDFTTGTLAKFRAKEEEKKKQEKEFPKQQQTSTLQNKASEDSQQSSEPKKAFQKAVPMLTKPGQQHKPQSNNQSQSKQNDDFDIFGDNSTPNQPQNNQQQQQQQQNNQNNNDDDFDWGGITSTNNNQQQQQQKQQQQQQNNNNNNNDFDFGWGNNTQSNSNQQQQQQQNNVNNQWGNQQQNNQQQQNQQQQQNNNNNANLFDDDFFGPSTGNNNNNQQQPQQNTLQNHPNILNMKGGNFMQQQAQGIPSINQNTQNNQQQQNNNNNLVDDFDDFVTAEKPKDNKDKIFKKYNQTEQALIDLSDLTLEDKKKKEQQAQTQHQPGGLYSTKEDLDSFGQNKASGNPFAPKPIDFSSMYTQGGAASQNNYNAFNNVSGQNHMGMQQQQQYQQGNMGMNNMGMNNMGMNNMGMNNMGWNQQQQNNQNMGMGYNNQGYGMNTNQNRQW